MKLSVQHQESYSRGELLLRAFFGIFYILLPHAFLLMFFQLWGSILAFLAWWMILFTGRYPESWFEYMVKLQRWGLRVNARVYNLCDGYPAFGLDSVDEKITFEVPYPEKLSRGTLLLKTFLGLFYVLLPHMLLLYFRMIWGAILLFLGFWTILFTGKLPISWHEFHVGTFRWNARVSLYMANMSDEYPPFSGQE